MHCDRGVSPRNQLVALALAATLAILRTSPAAAQCASNASSCVNCHEVQGLRPVLTDAQPWHADHGFSDLCAGCHQGDPDANSATAAHAGMCAPLDAPAVTCARCHADDADARAEGYRATLAAQPRPPAAPPRPAAARATGTTIDRALTAAAVALALVLGALLGHRRERGALGAWLRAATWTPYAAGAGLGLVVAITEVALVRPIAAAGAFDRLAAYPGRALFADHPYYAHVMRPQITWQVWLMVGLLLGSLASSRAAGVARWRWLPDHDWTPRFGPSRARRLALAFVGAALVQIGAGIAGGCTSGLAISGGATLAPAAFLFMAGMFAGGIPTAWAWSRGGRS